MERMSTLFKKSRLRRGVLFTALFLLAFLAIYRIGFQVPLAIVNQAL